MIIYNAKDIIKRSMQLADLENSDVITWNEQMNLINEAYKKLYQLVIDSNDKYYYKTISLKELVGHPENNISKYSLPEDFYQLASIKAKYNQAPLLRKAESEPITAQRYDLVNNELIIYGNADENELLVNYFPIPETITLKSLDYVVNSLPEGTVADCNANKYIGYTQSGTTVIIWLYDIAKNKVKDFHLDVESNEQVFAIYLGKKSFGVVIVNNNGQHTANKLYDLVKEQWITANDYTFAKADGNLYCVEDVGTTYDVYKENDLTNKYATEVEIVLPEGYDDGPAWTFTSNLEFFYVTSANKIYECNKYEAKEVLKTTDNRKLTVIKDELYSVNDDVLVDGEVLINGDEIYSVIGFNKIDDDTGYGITVINEDDELVVKSCFVDTILNFPNNFYFNYMSYMLAVAYKLKQGADATGVLAQAETEKNAFFDMENRDVSNFVRITNVYGSGLY